MPKLLMPKDTLEPRDRHMAELFHGYFKARYGFMKEFSDMYNEGIQLLRSAKQPVSLEYMENFLNIMRRRYHPGEKVPKKDKPRLFKVEGRWANPARAHVFGHSNYTAPITYILTEWPMLAQIIESSQFKSLTVVADDGSSLMIVKIPEEEIVL